MKKSLIILSEFIEINILQILKLKIKREIMIKNIIIFSHSKITKSSSINYRLPKFFNCSFKRNQ